MRDLFNGAPHSSAVSETDSFRWVVGVFSGNGAIEIIRRANKRDLRTFYPVRKTLNGEYAPLWRSYLFIEFREAVTINLCRTTANFIKMVSERDEDGVAHPVLVRKNSIDESLRLMTQGKFDNVTFKRNFHGRGTIVRIIGGAMAEQRAKLEMDVTPEMIGSHKVLIDINGIKAKIELHKLAL
jgi:transcription antitermination factor NusG